MNKVLHSYLRRLTNLSSNNRSILLLRLISDQFLDLHDLDFVNNSSSFSIIEKLILQKPKVKLCDVLDSRDEKNNEVSYKLKKIQRIENFIYEERGAKDLYVGWPFVRGKFKDGTLVRCPLIFFPVNIEEENKDWVLKTRPEIPITFNKSFLMAYAHYNEIKIEDSFLDYNFEELDTDSRIYRTTLYQLFKNSSIEINFNQELFIDKLQPFQNFKKSDFEESTSIGELKLFPEAVLGIFPQAGSYLVPDYETIINHQQFKDIEDFFVSRTTDTEFINTEGSDFRLNFLNKVKEENTFTPYQMDAYQENAVKAVKKGNSIVVQGPPGTGKSQLICNLIADAMASGRRVLLVSQKKAALDVVYKRLEENEIADFVALVHDFKNDRKDVYLQIKNQVDNLQEYKIKNNSLDSISLERKFYQSSRRIDQLSEELEEFKQALYDDSECGMTVKELYLTSDLHKPFVNLKQEYNHIRFDELDGFTKKLKNYLDYACIVERTEYPWKVRNDFQNYTSSDLSHIIKTIEEIKSYKEIFSAKSQEITGSLIPFDEGEQILAKEFQIKEVLELLKEERVYEYFKHMVDFNEKVTDSLWLSNVERVLIDCYIGMGPESTLPSNDLGKFQMALHHRMEAKKNLIQLIRWHLFSQDKMFIKKVMAANGILPNKKGFNALVDKIDSRLNLEHNLTKLKKNPWLKDIPSGYSKIDFQSWFFFQKRALIAKLVFCSVRNFKDYFNVQKLSYPELQEKITQLLQLCKELHDKKERWLKYLSPRQILQAVSDDFYIEQLIKTVKKDFELIREMDILKSSFQDHENLIIEKLLEETGDFSDKEHLLGLFMNSLKIAWIEHIEMKYPVLRSTGSLKFKKLESELQECVKQKQKISNDIVLLKLRERAYHEVEYNRLNNMVTYRDLYHQVSKKKMVWPIRKVFSYFEKEIFKLIPCWMASPESVSAMFPMEDLFDLVIFDEASQCFAEKGIPAMYRGKQIVVAGDDKQLAPNDLYRARWEEASEENPELEVDSLLDLSKKHLMQVHLQGHYRSKSLDLIEFSNRNFYRGKLKLLPDYSDIIKNEPGIIYEKVEGTWENNTNKSEAERIIHLIRSISISHPEKEIGVVTFNAKQQGLIVDLLEEHKLKPKGLIVKNIENVQGDEKDIIIFSVGYAPDLNGKLVMHFGSLNQAYGENRLNVAITRAREKIYVVTSIFPEQLRVDGSKNDGPKLLKEYLQYAKEISDGKYKHKSISTPYFVNEWYLKLKLINDLGLGNNNISLDTSMPFADVTISYKDIYSGLILTDDDLYYSSTSIKEAHVYKPFSFSNKNWKYLSFFSREYWQNQEAVKEEINKFIYSFNE